MNLVGHHMISKTSQNGLSTAAMNLVGHHMISKTFQNGWSPSSMDPGDPQKTSRSSQSAHLFPKSSRSGCHPSSTTPADHQSLFSKSSQNCHSPCSMMLWQVVGLAVKSVASVVLLAQHLSPSKSWSWSRT